MLGQDLVAAARGAGLDVTPLTHAEMDIPTGRRSIP